MSLSIEDAKAVVHRVEDKFAQIAKLLSDLRAQHVADVAAAAAAAAAAPATPTPPAISPEAEALFSELESLASAPIEPEAPPAAA